MHRWSTPNKHSGQSYSTSGPVKTQTATQWSVINKGARQTQTNPFRLSDELSVALIADRERRERVRERERGGGGERQTDRQREGGGGVGAAAALKAFCEI